MRIFTSFIVLLICLHLHAQETSRLKIYIDCQQVQCNLDFMRQQISIADFVRDRQGSDVHVLISTQPAGNGGSKYTVQLIGQALFSNLTDTFSFFVQAVQTENDIRELMIARIKTGLVPFFSKAGQATHLVISFETAKGNEAAVSNDKWNYWVFSVGGGINLSGDKNYKESGLRGNFSASRITDRSKIDFSVYNSSYRNKYTFVDGNQKSILKTTNTYLYATHSYVKSLHAKWSAGYEASFRKSSYDNIKAAPAFAAGIEYNIYPYKASSNKFLVIRYRLGAEDRKYLEETIFSKMGETLFYNDLGVYAAFTQPWGSVSSFLAWYNYLHDGSRNNLSFHANVELRLFKGFSLNFYGDASLNNDQLSLAKGGATSEEVLLRLKALSTSYNYYTGLVLTYRFGSAYNNFVNPRFTSGR
ncbi:MAG: hypothetical protein WCF67_05235 [Chitinophagaceae bacterium]